MLLRITLSCFSILIGMVQPAIAQEPVKPPLAPKIMTATRQVTFFTGLEKQVLAGIQKKDETALKELLADDFEIWMPNGDPIAGEDWLPAVLGKYNLKSFRISQMSVRDFGDTAIVKFMRGQKAEFQSKDDSGEYFVVDVWRKAGDSWKLSDRYVAKIRAVASTPKPTGKE
jgi:ketosteroid isomerase-like protein